MAMDKVDPCVRLYKQPKILSRPEKTANDAVISDLPGETLRWIKKHRRLDSESKMVLSHNRERQLRDIFNGIDIGKHGTIHLTELTEAVSFVSERLKNKMGTFEGFDRIIDIFRDMDDNGDGEVDFREFTNAMSGSSRSALDKASEQDIANLHRCFLEFGVMKSRRYAIAKINEYTGLTFAGEGARNFRSVEDEQEEELARQRKKTGPVIDDLRSYKLFRTLFEEKRDVSKSFRFKLDESLDSNDEAKLTPEEILLKEFHAENKRIHMAGTNDPEKEAAFDDMHERLKQAKLREMELLARDPDALAMQAQHEEALRYFASRRKERPVRIMNPYLVTVDGKPIPNSLSTSTAFASPQPDTHRDLQMQLAAKREAYNVLRSLKYLSPLERQKLRGEITTSGGDGSAAKFPNLQVTIDNEQEGSLKPSESVQSSLERSRSTSNLPTSRKGRPQAALQQSRSMAAFLCDADRPSTAPAAGTVTVKLAAPWLTASSPRIANVPTPTARSRPGTASAVGRSVRTPVAAGVGEAGRPQTAQRLRLRSPKHMYDGVK